MCIFCQPEEGQVDLGLSDADILAAERCPNLSSRVPATVVTGFLGAGKTTLVNWLLQGSHGQRFCVLQNESQNLTLIVDPISSCKYLLKP